MSPFLASRAFQIGFLLYTSLLILLGRAAAFALRNYDDAWYAQKAKELLASGGFWVVPYHGQPSFENTPLPLWLMALSYKLFGVSAYTAVLPTALLGTATVLLTYLLCERLFEERWTAFLAGFVLLFPGFYVDYARRAMVDVPLTFFVTAALSAFYLAQKNARWYLVSGLCTAMAILSKSILGAFPLVIGFLYLVLARRFGEFRKAPLWAGTFLALILGSSWYLVNGWRFDGEFFRVHFGWLILHRGLTGTDALDGPGNTDPLFFLGYFFDLLKNYWPWIPAALAGGVIFARQAVREGDRRRLFILLWIGVVFLVMSSARSQTLRYILPVFPALSILTAVTLAEWIPITAKERLLAVMAGVLMLVVLFVNATPIQIRQSTSLSDNSADIRKLAPVVRLNTRSGVPVGNFRLAPWNPRNALYFYAERFLDSPVNDREEWRRRAEANPQSTWLTSTAGFAELRARFPLYLIQSNGPYIYFTAAGNRENIRYDFP